VDGKGSKGYLDIIVPFSDAQAFHDNSGMHENNNGEICSASKSHVDELQPFLAGQIPEFKSRHSGSVC